MKHSLLATIALTFVSLCAHETVAQITFTYTAQNTHTGFKPFAFYTVTGSITLKDTVPLVDGYQFRGDEIQSFSFKGSIWDYTLDSSDPDTQFFYSPGNPIIGNSQLNEVNSLGILAEVAPGVFTIDALALFIQDLRAESPLNKVQFGEASEAFFDGYYSIFIGTATSIDGPPTVTSGDWFSHWFHPASGFGTGSRHNGQNAAHHDAFSTVVVPEPSTYAMILALCLGLIASLRRRH